MAQDETATEAIDKRADLLVQDATAIVIPLFAMVIGEPDFEREPISRSSYDFDAIGVHHKSGPMEMV